MSRLILAGRQCALRGQHDCRWVTWLWMHNERINKTRQTRASDVNYCLIVSTACSEHAADDRQVLPTWQPHQDQSPSCQPCCSARLCRCPSACALSHPRRPPVEELAQPVRVPGLLDEVLHLAHPRRNPPQRKCSARSNLVRCTPRPETHSRLIFNGSAR